jgi:hypothetical protein
MEQQDKPLFHVKQCQTVAGFGYEFKGGRRIFMDAGTPGVEKEKAQGKDITAPETKPAAPKRAAKIGLLMRNMLLLAPIGLVLLALFAVPGFWFLNQPVFAYAAMGLGAVGVILALIVAITLPSKKE